jgi:hypothetical protein
VVTVVSGETDTPVAGAQVIVAGTPHATDGAGQAVVQAAAEGATVDVEAAGFLTRQTLVRNAVTRLTMWPDDAKLSGDRYYDPRDEHGFTERETLVMGLIYLRRGGNTWPDNDRVVATSGMRLRVFVD